MTPQELLGCVCVNSDGWLLTPSFQLSLSPTWRDCGNVKFASTLLLFPLLFKVPCFKICQNLYVTLSGIDSTLIHLFTMNKTLQSINRQNSSKGITPLVVLCQNSNSILIRPTQVSVLCLSTGGFSFVRVPYALSNPCFMTI